MKTKKCHFDDFHWGSFKFQVSSFKQKRHVISEVLKCLSGLSRLNGSRFNPLTKSSSIAKQFSHPFPRISFAAVGLGFGLPIAEGKFKKLTEIADVLFQNRLGPSLAALLRHVRIVKRAVEAHAQVGAAFPAGFAAPRLAVEGPRLAAMVAKTVHSSAFRVQCWKSPRFLQH